jgi:hypothetical protein
MLSPDDTGPRALVAGAAAAALLAGACGRADAPDAGDASAVRFDTLPSPAPAGARWPNLAADDGGRLYLTWLEPAPDSAPNGAARDTVWRVRFATLDRGAASWSAPRTVAEGRDLVVNWTDFPAVVPLGGGRLGAQWPVRDPRTRAAYGPRVALSADGGATWTPAVAPHRSPAPAEYDFAVLLPAAGDSLGVAWLDGRAGAATETENYSLYYTTVSASGALGAERVVDTLTCACCRNAVARTRRGVALAFRNRTPDETRDIHVRRYEGGAWSGAVPVHADGWHIEGCPVNGAAAAALGDSLAVAWYTGAGDSARVQVAFSRDGGRTFGAPVRVDDGAPVGRAGAALTSRGDALVSWIERAGGGATDAELRVRLVRADGGRAPSRAVAPSAAQRASGVPQLVAVGDTAYLAWTVPVARGGVPSVRVARGAIR